MFIALAMVAANPVYLACSFSEARVFDVAVDEANQKVTIGFQGQDVTTSNALFTPTKVTTIRPLGNETQTWTIDRTSLDAEYVVSWSPIPSRGVCKVQPAPAKRAF